MPTFLKLISELSQMLGSGSNPADNPPKISQPIDRGALDLLGPHAQAYIQYPPLEVEYLIRTLNEHLSNCLDIRQKAQDLEAKAFSEVSEQILQRKLLVAHTEQVALLAEYEPQVLANQIGVRFEGGVISGTNSKYWAELAANQRAQIEHRLKDVNDRLDRLSEEGGGSHYVARFEFLKKLFDLDLVQAYCRARAASLGLKKVYGLNMPVPEVVDTAYLDQLVLWGRAVTYELERRLFSVRETTVAFALHDADAGEDVPRIMSKADFDNMRTSGAFRFKLKQEHFARTNLTLKNPRLRGIDVHVWVDTRKVDMHFWRVRIVGPVQDFREDVALVHKPKVFIPMATYPVAVAEAAEVPNQREVHNINPVGDWEILIEKKSVVGALSNWADHVGNIILRLRVAYDREVL